MWLPCEGYFCFPSCWCCTPSSLCKASSHQYKYFWDGKFINVSVHFAISERKKSFALKSAPWLKELKAPCSYEKYGSGRYYRCAKNDPAVVSQRVEVSSPVPCSRGILDENYIECLVHLCWIGNHAAPSLNLVLCLMSHPNSQGSSSMDYELDYIGLWVMGLIFYNTLQTEIRYRGIRANGSKNLRSDAILPVSPSGLTGQCQLFSFGARRQPRSKSHLPSAFPNARQATGRQCSWSWAPFAVQGISLQKFLL